MPGLSEFSSGFGLDESLTKSGKRKAKAEDAALDNSKRMQQIAEELYGTTKPLRDQSVGQLNSFLSTGAVPGAVDPYGQQAGAWNAPMHTDTGLTIQTRGFEPRSPGREDVRQFMQTGEIPGSIDTAARSVPGRQLIDAFMQTGEIPGPIDTAARSVPGRQLIDAFMQTGEIPGPIDLEPQTAYQRDVLEHQFRNARGDTIAGAPTMGGNMSGALTDLESQRALGVTGIASQQAQQENALRQQLFNAGLTQEQQDQALRQSLFNTGLTQEQQDQALREQLYSQAAGLGWGQPQTALSGLAGSTTGFTNVASLALTESLEKQKRAQDKAQTWGSFGMSGMGGGGGA